jgi:hypothetical protein
MGGVKGSGAFAKGSDEASQLYWMFMKKELALTAEPGDVIALFPELKEKTTTQIRSGFNRIRDNAKDALSALSIGDESKNIFCKKIFITKYYR